MLGIDNLKLGIDAVAGLGNVTADVLKDGKVNALDFGAIVALYPVFMAASQIKFAELFPEGKDIDASEMAELEAYFEAKLQFPAELASVEAKIEAVVELCSEIAEFGAAGYKLFLKASNLFKK